MRSTLSLAVCSAALSLAACATAPTEHRYSRHERGSEPTVVVARDLRGEEPRSERDEMITSTIRAQFARDPQVNSRDIDIDTYRGTVELSGVVDDRDDIRRAVRIALATPGVRSVRNDMRVAR